MKDMEYFSTLDPDKPTGAHRSFASFLGELVLVTDYNCLSDEIANAMLVKLVKSSEGLDESIAFEFRGAEILESGGLRSVILFPEGGLLSTLLHSDVNLGWYFRIKLAVNICRGLLELHDSNRIHNDLRPSMLGLDCEWRCKFLELICVENVTDMYCPHPLSVGVRGDIRYLAPEILRESFCTGASDMYSFGLVLFELCARVPVHAVPRDSETQSVPVDELLELLPETTPSSLVELIRQLINIEMEYRPGVEDALDWLDSLLMETSPQNDPGDPPLPPLPFTQRRISSRHAAGTFSHSRSLSGGSVGKVLAISPKNAQRLREIADAQKAEERASSKLNRDQISRIDEDADEGDSSPLPKTQVQKQPERRMSITAPNVIVGTRCVNEDPNELKGFVQLKAHNLPIYKNKYFFFKDGHLVWCSDKKHTESPERLHYFDLTHAQLDEAHSTGVAVCLVKISSEEEATASNAKAGGVRKNFFASSSKEREKLLMKFSSAEVAEQWKAQFAAEISRARCQMCKCRVDLTREQLFQRARSRLLREEGETSLSSSSPDAVNDLAIYCSEPCYMFKAKVNSKGMGVAPNADGVAQLFVTNPAMKIDKKMVSRRNPAAWRRMSKKYGVHQGSAIRDSLNLHHVDLPPSIEAWLATINQSGLLDVFKTHNYSDIFHIMVASLCEDDMEYMAINSKDTRKCLIDAAETLRNNYMRNLKVAAATRQSELC